MKPTNRLPDWFRAEPEPERKELNYLAIVKGPEKYVFIYDDDSRVETQRVLGRFASNPELSFTWYDASVLSQKIRQGAAKTKAEAARQAAEPWRQSLREDD